MISKPNKSVPLLEIDNRHTTGCGAPPEVDAAGKYVSYFENPLGEQWVLVGDLLSGKAVIYAGDCGWQRPIEVSVEQPFPRATLQETEKMWLVACLAAMGKSPFGDILARYNSKQSGCEN